LALLPVRTVAEDLETSVLQQVLPSYSAPTRALYAVHSPGVHTLRTVRVFLDYISAWFAKNPMPQHASV
jgi:DNA-binding transcriptional LysR family regulator